MEGKKLAREMMDMVNVMGSNREDVNEFINTVLNEHRTLQQAFFGQVILAFIEKVCNEPDYMFDGRNEAMRKYCNAIVESLMEKNLAFARIKPDGKEYKKVFELPLI